MSVMRPSLTGKNSISMKCAAALSQFEDLEEPADIEEAVIKAIPKDQPQRDETIETFAKVCIRMHILPCDCAAKPCP